MKQYLTGHALRGWAFLLCTLLLAASYSVEWLLGWSPCSLCLIQRYVVFVLVIGFGVGFLWLRRRRVLSFCLDIVMLAFAGLGLSAAARQVWLQQLPPDQMVACTPNLHIMLSYLPLEKVILMLLKGGGDCAKIHMRFLGLSMGGWMVVVFSGLLLLTLWHLIKGK